MRWLGTGHDEDEQYVDDDDECYWAEGTDEYPYDDPSFEGRVYLPEGALSEDPIDGEWQEIIRRRDDSGVYASYGNVQKSVRDEKKARGFHVPPRIGKRKSGKVYGFRGKGLGKAVSIEEIKLRSRCNRCGTVGHWAKDCLMPDTRSKFALPSSSDGSSTGRFTGTFFQAAGDAPTFFVGMQAGRNLRGHYAPG